jgi:predicted TIM-barrel fold metal-dependent hydrolase
MIVDGLMFLGTSHFGTSLDASTAISHLDAASVDVAVAAPTHPHRGNFTEANDALLAAAEQSGGRIVPLARVDPWEGSDAVIELKRAIAGGARGLFLHPSEERFRANDIRVRPIVEAAAEANVPIIVSAGYHLYSEPLQLGAASTWVPDTPFILTNGGQFNISGMSQFDAQLALGGSNVYVQTSGMYRQDFLEGVVATFGANRLIFASAEPVFEMAYELQRVALAHFTDTEEHLIMGGTCAELFGIEDLL